MTGRCIWCNKISDNLRTVTIIKSDHYSTNPKKETFTVHRDHERPFRTFKNKVNRHGNKLHYAMGFFFMLIIGFGIILLSFDRAMGLTGISIVTATMGLLLVIFPFTTLGTIKKIGAATTSRIVQTIGVILVGIGIWLLTMSFN